MNLDALQSAFDAAPQSAPYHELVTGYVSAGRMTDALIVAQQVVAHRPQDVAARRLMGWVMLTQNQVRAAMQAFAEALQQDPADAESRFLYGLCLERLDETDQAKVQLGYVIQAVPNHAGALEALKRLEAGEEPPPPREDKTVMMSLDDIVSSKTYTGTAPGNEPLESTPQTDPGDASPASSPQPAPSEHGDAPSTEAMSGPAEEQTPKPQVVTAATQELASTSPVTASHRHQPPQAAPISSPSPAPADTEEQPVGARHAPLISIALAVLVTVLLLGLHHFYGAWADAEKAVAQKFSDAERAFISDGVGQLRRAAALAEEVTKEKPENDHARGLAAHALARLELEYKIPGQLERASKLLQDGSLPLSSLHGRTAEAMVLRAAGKRPQAVSALEYSTPDGRKLNIPMFRRERALNLADQNKNKEALEELNKALENGGTRRDLLLTMANFQLHRGTGNAAFSYASRVLANVDQLHQEVKRSKEDLKKADQAETSSKTAIPALEKELAALNATIEKRAEKKATDEQAKSLKALKARLQALQRLDRDRPQLRQRLKRTLERAQAAIPKLEVAPALILRAASLVLRERPALANARKDLERALKLSPCATPGIAVELACISEAHRQQAVAMAAALARRLDGGEKASPAQNPATADDPISLLIDARTAMDQGRFEEAKALANKAAGMAKQSALPLMLQLEVATRAPEPKRDDEAYDRLLKTFPALQARARLMAIERSSRAGDLEDANARIGAYLKAFPTQSHYARYLEGRALYFAAQYPEALKVFEEILEKAVTRGDMALGHRIMVSMMRTFGKMRRTAPMRKILKDILQDNPKQAEALYIAASLLNDRAAEKTLLEQLPADRWTLSLKAR